MEQFQFAGFTWPRQIPRLVSPSYCGEPEPLKRMRERYAVAVANRVNGQPDASPKPHRFKVDTSYRAAPRPGSSGVFGYLESDFFQGFRWTWADEVEGASIEHTGWWTDEGGTGETIRGIVVRLTHGRGFLAGYSMGEGMATSLETAPIYDDESSAAYAADSIAERVAEDERERSEVGRALDDYERAGEELETLTSDAVALRGVPLDALSDDARDAMARRLEALDSEAEELEQKRAELESMYGAHERWKEGN